MFTVTEAPGTTLPSDAFTIFTACAATLPATQTRPTDVTGKGFAPTVNLNPTHPVKSRRRLVGVQLVTKAVADGPLH
jgi:hypothetical protein